MNEYTLTEITSFKQIEKIYYSGPTFRKKIDEVALWCAAELERLREEYASRRQNDQAQLRAPNPAPSTENATGALAAAPCSAIAVHEEGQAFSITKKTPVSETVTTVRMTKPQFSEALSRLSDFSESILQEPCVRPQSPASLVRNSQRTCD